MILTIVAIAKNDCDYPDDRMGTPIFFSVKMVTIRIATIVGIETIVLSWQSWRSSDDQRTIENLMKMLLRRSLGLRRSVCSLQCISFLGLHHLQNGVFRISQQRGATSGTDTNFYLRSTKVWLYDIDMVGTTKMNTKSLIVGQKLARN